MDEDNVPLLYKRKYADGDDVSFKDLRKAYQLAARLIVEEGEEYIPLFERLDKEVEMRKNKEKLKVKAQRISKRKI